MSSSLQFQSLSVFESLCADLEETASLASVFADTTENIEPFQNTENMNIDQENPPVFLPSPQKYCSNLLYQNMDTKAMEEHNAYRAYYNRTLGPVAHL